MTASVARVEMQIGPAAAWVDVTCDVLASSWGTVKEAQHEPFQPGDAKVELLDDGKYHPMNPDSPYREAGATLLRTGAPVRIDIQPGGVGAYVRLFTGVVRLWPVALSGSGAGSTSRVVECVDALGVQAERDVATIVVGAPQEGTQARVDRWLAAGGITGAARDLSIPVTLTHEKVDIRGKVLAGIRATVASTMDDVWCARSGVVMAREATCLLTPPGSPTITFSNLPGSTTPAVDVETASDVTVRKILRRREIGYSDPLGQSFTGTLVASALLPATGSPVFGETVEEGPCDLVPLAAEVQESARRRALSQPYDGFAVRSVVIDPDWHPDIRTWLLAADPIRRWVAVEHRAGPAGSPWTMTRTGWIRSERHEWTPGRGNDSWRVTIGIDDQTGTAPTPTLATELDTGGSPWVITATPFGDEVVVEEGSGPASRCARFDVSPVTAEACLSAGASSASVATEWDDSVAGTGGYGEIQVLASKGFINSGGYSGTDYADMTVTADASASFQSDIRVTWEKGASHGSVLLGSKAGGGGHIPHITMPGTLVVEGNTTPAGAGKLGVFNVAAAPVAQQAIPTTATALAEKMQAYGLLAPGAISIGAGGAWNETSSGISITESIDAVGVESVTASSIGTALAETLRMTTKAGSVAYGWTISQASATGSSAYVRALASANDTTEVTSAELLVSSNVGDCFRAEIVNGVKRAGFFASLAPQQPTPTTLSDVIAILRAFGLAA